MTPLKPWDFVFGLMAFMQSFCRLNFSSTLKIFLSVNRIRWGAVFGTFLATFCHFLNSACAHQGIHLLAKYNSEKAWETFISTARRFSLHIGSNLSPFTNGMNGLSHGYRPQTPFFQLIKYIICFS